MPSGKIHDLSILAATPLVYTGAITFAPEMASEISYAFIVCGLMASPDLDIESSIYMRWGWFKWYWYPYQKIIHHRSWVSHSGPVSALIRLFYLIPLLIPLYIYAPQLLVPITIAMIISDSLHTVMDVISTALIRLKNRVYSVGRAGRR